MSLCGDAELKYLKLCFYYASVCKKIKERLQSQNTLKYSFKQVIQETTAVTTIEESYFFYCKAKPVPLIIINMLTICSMSVNCRQIRSERDCLLSMFSDTSVWNNNVHRLKLLDLKQLHFVLYMGVFVFWVNKITQVNTNISLFIWQTEIYTR